MKTLSYVPLTDDQRWFWHAYDYGWRRVVVGDFAGQSPIDRDGQWFDPALAYAAECFYRRKFNKPLPEIRPAPSAEDIAYVERVCAKIRENLEAWGKRNQQAFAKPRRPMSPEALAEWRRGLGSRATAAEAAE